MFSMENETKIINLEKDTLYTSEQYQQLREQSLLTLVLRGRWCDIIVLNVHAPSEEKSDDLKYSSYKDLEQGF